MPADQGNSRAEEVIAKLTQDLQLAAREKWRGRERDAVIEIVRTLDDIAFAFTMAPNRIELVEQDDVRHCMLRGAVVALRPFLESLRNDSRGVPWRPSNPHVTRAAEALLFKCGELAQLRRIVSMERYGVARTRFKNDRQLVVEVDADTPEASDRESLYSLVASRRKRHAEKTRRLAAMARDIRDRIDARVRVDEGWFIRYDSDAELLEYYRELAAIGATGIPESEALPPDTLLGGRRFADWNAASITALGRILHHIAFATRLKATHSGLDLRNLLTVFARKDDLAAVWEESGENAQSATQLMSCMSLDAASASSWEDDHEIPVPFYVDFGRDFVLLPAFGGLLNPCAAVVRELKNRYRREWDRGVEGRETAFRADLRNLLPLPRFEVLPAGIKLRRPDGSELTDIDAIVLDHKTGSLALVQLKWHDIFGRSPREWNSRRLNLLHANEWVDRVAGWVAARSAAKVAATLRIGAARNDRHPELLVVARNGWRFTTTQAYDERAAWLGWADLVHATSTKGKGDILQRLTTRFRGGGKLAAEHKIKTRVDFNLPELHVEVHIGG